LGVRKHLGRRWPFIFIHFKSKLQAISMKIIPILHATIEWVPTIVTIQIILSAIYSSAPNSLLVQYISLKEHTASTDHQVLMQNTS
jgi:hypothetical protein